MEVVIKRLEGDREALARIKIMQEIVRRMIAKESLDFISV